MPRMNVVHRVTGAVPAILLVLTICGSNAVKGEGVPTLGASLTQGRALAEQGRYAEALRTVVDALEAHPNALDHGAYDRVRKETFKWFARVPAGERADLLAEYHGGSGSGGDVGGVPFAGLLDWLRSILPTTSVRSPDAMLVLSGWHHQLRNTLWSQCYAIVAFEQAPRSTAGEHAIQVLITWRYYGGDREGMARTARVAARVDPDGWPACWAACRMVVYYMSTRRIDEAKALCGEIRQIAGAGEAGQVVRDLELLIRDVEAQAFPAAMNRVWDLRRYLFDEVPAIEVFGTLCSGIDWRRLRDDPDGRLRRDRLTHALQTELERGTHPERRACALLLLGHIAQSQGRIDQAIEIYQRAVDTGFWVAEEYALGQMGRLLLPRDSARAAACFERKLERFGATAVGNEGNLEFLGAMYRKLGRYQEGLDLLLDVERRCDSGEAMVYVKGPYLMANIVGCLRGLGRYAEAEARAAPLLQPRGYGLPVGQLTRRQLGELWACLLDMGRDADAAVYRAEIDRRRREKAGRAP